MSKQYECRERRQHALGLPTTPVKPGGHCWQQSKEKEIRKRGGGRRVGKGDTDFDNYIKREWASFREVNYSHER